MKQIFSTVFFFILVINTHAQNKNIISEIEKTVLDINNDESLTIYKVPSDKIAKVKKYGQDENIDVFKKGDQTVKIVDHSKDNGGGYKQVIIYLQNEKPIFIETESKTIIKARPVDFKKIEISESVERSKIFVINWDKDLFDHQFWDKKTNVYKQPEEEHKNLILSSKKDDVIRVLKLSQFATKNNVEE
ncbi:hypothetical protein LPB85_09305 [Chryseobacterium sp. LC2016-27]|uniref:hypothetical protein n=1 Tax=Chryseobacterium sp. LC2016-27 TaxID=2897326 RepID=UPI001E62AD27|nr:hypothetical protein [Chryseobacterium sp. LC2016-27]MCD0455643.1 hypothetical protein [Chryseobacterium sp. LC2016-27]